VGYFYPDQRNDTALLKNIEGFFTQLLRTKDAFQKIEQHEKENGWEYDVVMRVRPEVIHTDICDLGLIKAAQQKALGLWQ